MELHAHVMLALDPQETQEKSEMVPTFITWDSIARKVRHDRYGVWDDEKKDQGESSGLSRVDVERSSVGGTGSRSISGAPGRITRSVYSWDNG